MEERRIKGLVAQLIDAQLKRIDIKLKHFDELETMLDQEHQKVRTNDGLPLLLQGYRDRAV
jgi:hypothetical protein